jgi:hypothetical protein
MPAYFDTGFCVRQPSWHRQEQLLADYPETWAEARTIAGIDWEPEERRLGMITAETIDGAPVWAPVTTHKAIVRSDTGAHLGTVGADWTPITHAVEYLDHLRTYRGKDTLIGRQILRPEPLKAKAVRIAREVCAA